MDKQLAQMVASQAARSAYELSELVLLMKDKCNKKTYKEVGLLVASAIYEVGLIRERCFKEHPDLEKEFKARSKKYGRSF